MVENPACSTLKDLPVLLPAKTSQSPLASESSYKSGIAFSGMSSNLSLLRLINCHLVVVVAKAYLDIGSEELVPVEFAFLARVQRLSQILVVLAFASLEVLWLMSKAGERSEWTLFKLETTS